MKSPALLLAASLLVTVPWLSSPAAAHDRDHRYGPPRHEQRIHPHERRYHPPPPRHYAHPPRPAPGYYARPPHRPPVVQHHHYYAPPSRAYAPPPPPPRYYRGYSPSPAVVIGIDIPPLVIPLR